MLSAESKKSMMWLSLGLIGVSVPVIIWARSVNAPVEQATQARMASQDGAVIQEFDACWERSTKGPYSLAGCAETARGKLQTFEGQQALDKFVQYQNSRF